MVKTITMAETKIAEGSWIQFWQIPVRNQLLVLFLEILVQSNIKKNMFSFEKID